MDWLKIVATAQKLREGLSLMAKTEKDASNQKIIEKGYELEQALSGFIEALEENTKR
ncbi:MAG: hypothetical protein GXZ07_03565 [Firmicutes bacterium]|nr:hypothetical protein [Bacillota bacterium]